MDFYHGTSDVLKINGVIMSPIKTGVKREEHRNIMIDKVFITNLLISAEIYAKQACNKYGGNPIVYKVKPMGNIWSINKIEYVADKAIIIRS